MKALSSLDWRLPRSNPLEGLYLSNTDHMERRRSERRSPQRGLKAEKGKGVHRVPSPEELDKYGAASSSRSPIRGGGGGFKKDQEYQRSKELDPMEYAWLIQQGFVSSIQYTRRMKTTKKSTPSMQSFHITDKGKNMTDTEKNSKKNTKTDVGSLSSLQHLDLATGWESSRHVLVEEVISNVLASARKSVDLTRLQHLGLPPRYLPTIVEAIQAEHLAEFKHLDLANTGSLGQKRLDLRRLVESRLPTFLRSNVLPYSYSTWNM